MKSVTISYLILIQETRLIWWKTQSDGLSAGRYNKQGKQEVTK